MRYLFILMLLVSTLLVSTPAFADKVKVQVIFDEPTQYGTFTDALYFSPSEYATKSQAEINALKKERVDNFVARVTEASNAEPVEPTKEELIEQEKQLEESLVSLQAQKVEVGKKLIAILQAANVEPLEE